MKTHKLFSARAALALLGACVGACGLQAQEGYSYALKTRVGLTAGDMQKTHFDNKVMGFGAEVKREILGGGSAVTAELTWEYVPGRHHDVYPWDSYTPPSGPLGLDPIYSYDDRKEYGQGINLRLAFSSPFSVNIFPGLLPQLDFEWFAGLGLDRYKVNSEVKYTFNFTPSTPNPAKGSYDGGTFVEQGSQFVPGFFAGLKYRINSDFGLELSVRNFGMWHMEYIPSSYKYNGAVPPAEERGKGTTTTGTSRGWALEFAIAAKL